MWGGRPHAGPDADRRPLWLEVEGQGRAPGQDGEEQNPGLSWGLGGHGSRKPGRQSAVGVERGGGGLLVPAAGWDGYSIHSHHMIGPTP